MIACEHLDQTSPEAVWQTHIYCGHEDNVTLCSPNHLSDSYPNCLTGINLFNSPQNSLRWVLFLSSSHRWGNWGKRGKAICQGHTARVDILGERGPASCFCRLHAKGTWLIPGDARGCTIGERELESLLPYLEPSVAPEALHVAAPAVISHLLSCCCPLQLLTQLQLHRPPPHSYNLPNLFLPQGLRSCHSLCLKCLSSTPPGKPYHILREIREMAPDHPPSNSSPGQ